MGTLRAPDGDVEALARVEIQHSQGAEPPAIRELVGYELHTPDVVPRGRQSSLFPVGNSSERGIAHQSFWVSVFAIVIGRHKVVYARIASIQRSRGRCGGTGIVEPPVDPQNGSIELGICIIRRCFAVWIERHEPIFSHCACIEWVCIWLGNIENMSESSFKN